MEINNQKKICKNCDYPMDSSNKFCSNCGQLDLLKKISIFDFIQDFFSNFYAFDSKLLTSIRYLFLKPGIMAKEYINGRRLKFVNPFKLLLSFGILLGLLITFSDFVEELNYKNIDLKKEKEKKVESDSVKFKFGGNENVIIKNQDTTWFNKKKNIFYIKNYVPKQKEISGFINKFKFFNLYLKDNLNESYLEFCKKNNFSYSYLDKFMYEKTQIMKKEADTDKLIENSIKSNFAYLLFFALNFFAILMYVFFFRSGYNFTEHLVFIFYLFSNYIFSLCLFSIVELFSDYLLHFIICFLFFYNWIYFYKSLKNFYPHKILSFRINFLLLSFIMPFVLVLSFILIFFISFLMS